MKTPYILFISSNRIWAGSEVLWALSAREFRRFNKYRVKAAVFYDFEALENYLPHEDYIDLRIPTGGPSIYRRILRRLLLVPQSNPDKLTVAFQQEKPALVVISQGNNSDGRLFMHACVENSIPFVTLTHLVTEGLWPALNDEIIDGLRKLYKQSVKNYFVSRATMQLHEKLLGQNFSNNEVVYNPFRQESKPALKYPPVTNGIYKLALVGRIEIFHKGYDLLIDILKQEKWRLRNLQFSLFGRGPHVHLLKRMIKFNHIQNLTVHDHEEDISKIWSAHHMLIMPSRMEGQSLSLIEAMHFGRPAIVTDVGGSRELIEESVSGFIARHPTVESIDEALERAWQKREEWEQLGINASRAINEKHPADAISFFNQRIADLVNHPGAL